MKIRNGFVSNSSSSSFLILGNNIDILDVTSSMIKEKQIYFLGKYLNEGRDIFQIKKIEDSVTVGFVRKAGIRIEVHGHRKNSKGKYVMRIVDIS